VCPRSGILSPRHATLMIHGLPLCRLSKTIKEIRVGGFDFSSETSIDKYGEKTL
jgi:hypothetical protein